MGQKNSSDRPKRDPVQDLSYPQRVQRPVAVVHNNRPKMVSPTNAQSSTTMKVTAPPPKQADPQPVNVTKPVVEPKKNNPATGGAKKQQINPQTKKILKGLDWMYKEGKDKRVSIIDHSLNEKTRTSYEEMFAPYINSDLTGILIIDPHFNMYHQIANLVQFLELCVMLAPALKVVQIRTKRGAKSEQQLKNLEEIKTSLGWRKIDFIYDFDGSLHDRRIVFNNGHFIILGKGLDVFQKSHKQNVYIGMFEQKLKTCSNTSVEIYRIPTQPSTD